MKPTEHNIKPAIMSKNYDDNDVRVIKLNFKNTMARLIKLTMTAILLPSSASNAFFENKDVLNPIKPLHGSLKAIYAPQNITPATPKMAITTYKIN